MKVLLDVNIIVDICSLREPYNSQSLQAVDWISEDGSVFSDEDPEDAQLIKAVNRMGNDTLLLSRDKNLLERFDKAISPYEFIQKYIKSEEEWKQPIPFCDLKKQLDEYRPEMESSIQQVIESSAFINGSAVRTLAEELSSFAGVKHTIPCASGTDALLLALMALGVKPGDEIIVPAFTFIATASMVSFYKSIPVFVDVDPVTFNIDPEKIKSKITNKTVGIIPVSLYGQCAPMDEINAIASEHGLWVVEDAAQSFGADYKGRKSCNLSGMATTSFFPAKPLGCYGDGGAVFTNDANFAEKVSLYANHGQAKRYYHSEIGINGRMDSIQAAVVSVKLKHFEEEIKMRNKVAARYTEGLKGFVETPKVLKHNRSTWAQYTIQTDKREFIRKKLDEKNIPTAIHYPMPLPRQEAFSYLKQEVNFPVSDKLSRQVMSLPMHSFLREEEIDFICNTIKEAVNG
jgi:UDP-2-acetamido-2-deoxy-ribo-hexuluronate aminotransferase